MQLSFCQLLTDSRILFPQSTTLCTSIILKEMTIHSAIRVSNSTLSARYIIIQNKGLRLVSYLIAHQSFSKYMIWFYCFYGKYRCVMHCLFLSFLTSDGVFSFHLVNSTLNALQMVKYHFKCVCVNSTPCMECD